MKGRQGNLTAAPERWKHLDFLKRVFWKTERQAQDRRIQAEADEVARSRGIDRRARVDEFGDTFWPDSENPAPPLPTPPIHQET